MWPYHDVKSVPITRGNVAVGQLDLAVVIDGGYGNVISTPTGSGARQKKRVTKRVVFAAELVDILKRRASLTVDATSFTQLDRADSGRIFAVTWKDSSHLVARRGIVLARFVRSPSLQTETKILARCLFKVLHRLKMSAKISEEFVASLKHLLQVLENPRPGTIEEAGTTFHLYHRIVDIDLGKGRVASFSSRLVWQQTAGNEVISATLNTN